MVKALLEAGTVNNFEIKYRKKNGKIGYVLSSVSLLEIDGEKYIIFNSIDITEQKESQRLLRQYKERFSTVFNINPLLMIITRASDNIMIDYNKSFLHLAGFEHKELQNKTAMDLNLKAL